MTVMTDPMSQDSSSLPLEQQVVRLQALLEASRRVHSTIELLDVLQQTARIAVLELEMEGVMFTEPAVSFGLVPDASDVAAWAKSQRFPLIARDGKTITEMLVVTPEDRELSLYETDFLEGLVLQTAIAAENAANHKRHLEYARLAQDLDAARAIQQSLIPQVTPKIAGYSLAARSRACYSVGGDYLDMVTEPDGSHLMVVADVAGKGMASALVCTAFRSAFRALAKQSLTLKELAARLGQQHWEEGEEARRRYVTAIFMRLDAESHELEFVNAGHNPGFLLTPNAEGSFDLKTVVASGTPLGMLPGMRYSAERVPFLPGSRLLMYTDGLTEVFRGDEEFGEERLGEVFGTNLAATAEENLTVLWETLDGFTGGAHQQDDMTAIALYRLGGMSGKTGTRETA